MGETVQANDGAMLPLDSLPQQLNYTGSFISSINVTYAGQNYEQTFLNDGTNIIFISGWQNTGMPINQNPMISESGVVMVSESGQIMITE
jgi:hypothetical protein